MMAMIPSGGLASEADKWEKGAGNDIDVKARLEDIDFWDVAPNCSH